MSIKFHMDWLFHLYAKNFYQALLWPKRTGKTFLVLILGESTSGQRALYELGLTGIPIYNVCAILTLPLDETI